MENENLSLADFRMICWEQQHTFVKMWKFCTLSHLSFLKFLLSELFLKCRFKNIWPDQEPLSVLNRSVVHVLLLRWNDTFTFLLKRLWKT